MRNRLIALVLLAVLFAGLAAGCRNGGGYGENLTAPEGRNQAYPPDVDVIWNCDDDGNIIDYSDIYIDENMQRSFSSDVELIKFLINSGAENKAAVIWSVILIDVKRDNEWVRVNYCPRNAGHATWALSRTDSEEFNINTCAFFDFSPKDIYDETIYKNGKITPGEYRATAFVGDKELHIEFEITK